MLFIYTPGASTCADLCESGQRELLCHITVHKDKVADTSAHHKEMKNLM